jgi:anti-sigma factor RsiW
VAKSEQASSLSCEQCRELLSDYVDRELSESEKASVERHLSNCIKCGSESARLHGMKKIVQHWQGVTGSGEFRKSVMEKMIRESQQVPSQQFNDAAKASDGAAADSQRIEEVEERSLPPIWILLAAGVLAIAAYYLVLFLRAR